MTFSHGRDQIGLLGAWLILASLCTAATAEEMSKPNIVLIMADDLGYGDLGCYGQKLIATPRLDAMATEGMKFTNFYAGCTVCAPSRCVLMTGLHTGHCYIRGNARVNLRAGDVTIAEMFQNKGYATACFGKWGLGQEKSGGEPLLQGFDAFLGYCDQTHAHNYFPTFLIRDKGREPLNNKVPQAGKFGEGVATEKNQWSHDVIFAEALEFVRKPHDKPFFLYLPFTLPHANNEAKPNGMEIPDLGDYKDKEWPEPLKGTAAMISRLDRDVGVILDLLEELNLDKQTLVLFTSDNGPHAEGGNDPQFFASSGPYRGIKRDLHEGGLRVPMIARWPDHIAQGKTVDHVAYHGDFFTTLCDVAHLEPINGLDSLSFAPTLLGQPNQETHDYLYWEFHEGGFSQALRYDDWKAIRSGSPPIRGDKSKVNPKSVELYNLKDDPTETKNVVIKHPEIMAQLNALFAEAHVPSDEWPVESEKKTAK